MHDRGEIWRPNRGDAVINELVDPSDLLIRDERIKDLIKKMDQNGGTEQKE